MMRCFGSLVAIIDLFVKFAYYDHSRFVGQSIKAIYSSILGVRPVCLVIVFAYNYCFALKEIGMEYKRTQITLKEFEEHKYDKYKRKMI
jgi:hypothetical protein